MRFSRLDLNRILFGAGILATLATTGCGNSCFAGIFNNGNGTVIIKAASPPPTCSLSTGMGMMNMVAVKTPACAICPAATRLEHTFVTVRSIRLRSSDAGDKNSADGFEAAPQLASQPVRVDLIGDSSEALLKNANVPAGSYGEVRLQFAADAQSTAEQLPKNACGSILANCIVTSDGQVEPLRLTGNSPELVIPFAGNSLVIVPDAKVDLRLRLRPQLIYVSDREGWRGETSLAGSVEVIRR